MAQRLKRLPAIGDLGSIPRSGRSLGEGNVVPGEEPQPPRGGRGGAWPWGPPRDAGRKLCESGSLPAAPGLLVGRVSVARLPGKHVLQPRALPSEIRRSQHRGGQKRVPEPSRESWPRLGAVQRRHNLGTGGWHPWTWSHRLSLKQWKGAPRMLWVSMCPPAGSPLLCLGPHARPVTRGSWGACPGLLQKPLLGECLRFFPSACLAAPMGAVGRVRDQENHHGRVSRGQTRASQCALGNQGPGHLPVHALGTPEPPGWGAVHRKASCPGRARD